MITASTLLDRVADRAGAPHALHVLPHLERNVHCLLGLPFDAIDLVDAQRRIRAAAESRSRCFVSTANVNFLVGCLDDPAFRRSILVSNLNLADGAPLVWIAKLLGIPISERVAGATLFDSLERAGRDGDSLSVYFFGGPEGSAANACRRLNAGGGALRCAGSASPGYGAVAEMSTGEIIEQINSSGADMLVVALGARKGQAWIVRNLDRLQVPVVSHLGAVVNFVAGTVMRAPQWMQRIGLEWLWRIRQEPHLWRRYLHDGAVLLRLLMLRVLPHVLLLLLWRPSRSSLEAATLTVVEERDSNVLLTLQGSWVEANLAPLRAALQSLATAERNVSIDLAGVEFVDSALLGQLMIFHGSQAARGRTCVVRSMTPRVRLLFSLSCAEYLLASVRTP